MKIINDTLKIINSKTDIVPELAIILGSGLSHLAETLTDSTVIPYSDLPIFPTSTVKGHNNQLVIGKLAGKNTAVLSGRFHYYEGYTMREITDPLFMLNELGVKKIIITNAAGSLSKEKPPGTVMFINDHINFMGSNPLIGLKVPDRFIDMSNAYTPSLIDLAAAQSKETAFKTFTGVYAGMHGPSYETAAEIRMLKKMGADAVGMSTVPEVIISRYLKWEILGISTLTNYATGISEKTLNHNEVLDTNSRIKNDLSKLISSIAGKM
ncbi:MAG: purine-nucleoside phosphorylase [Spirochaetes bacterium]|nr:purine-nucleoside phosphorylase [Spirochaetota bacterium]